MDNSYLDRFDIFELAKQAIVKINSGIDGHIKYEEKYKEILTSAHQERTAESFEEAGRHYTAHLLLELADEVVIKKIRKNKWGYAISDDISDSEDLAEPHIKEGEKSKATIEANKKALRLLRRACCDKWEPAPPTKGMPKDAIMKSFKSKFLRNAVQDIAQAAAEASVTATKGGDVKTETLKFKIEDNKDTGEYKLILNKLPRELARCVKQIGRDD